jgi:hypothetical protein
MKKITAFMILGFLLAGCAFYPPYRPMPQQRLTNQPQKQADAPAAAGTLHAPDAAKPKPMVTPQPRKVAGPPPPDDLFYSFEFTPVGAQGIFTAAFGWQPGSAPLDLSLGLGGGFLGWGWTDLGNSDADEDAVNLKSYNTAFLRARFLLRRAKSTPFFFFSYIYNMPVPNEQYTLDTEVATYSVGSSSFFGAGFGFLWRVNPGINFTAMIGYNKRIRGANITYESGDNPATAPELYEKLEDAVPDDTPAVTLGLEFRF